jgi:hypothetical protein
MFEGPQGLPVFKANGEEFLTIYKDICDLRADEKVLDVGSSRRHDPLHTIPSTADHVAHQDWAMES